MKQITNLLKKNKDGSAYYYWKSYQQLEGGALRFFDADLLPFKNELEFEISDHIKITDSLFDNLKEKIFNFDGDRFDHMGMVDIYLKFSNINNAGKLTLEEIRFHVPPKEVNKIEDEKRDFTQHLRSEEYGLFDQTYKTYQYESLKLVTTDIVSSSKGNLAFYNNDDEDMASITNDIPIKFYGKKLQQNSKRHNKQIEQLIKMIPHFDQITEPFEHINDDASEEHGFGIQWKAGDYNVHHMFAHQKKHMFSKKDINIHFPCCKKIIDYEKGEFIGRWGVSYLRCEDCDKDHPISEKDNNFKKEFYKLKDGSDIDYSWQGIKSVFHPDTVSFYGWVVKPKTKENFDIDFMHHD